MASNKNGNKSLPLEKKELVEKVFKRFDANGDGKISISELDEVMRSLGSKPSAEDLVNMMAEMDSDGDGFIDLNEFSEFHKGTAADSTELRDAFDLYDQNKDGFISAVELHSVLKSLGDKCSVEDCSRMILSVDSDGDGCVNFEEFKRMICNANNGNR